MVRHPTGERRCPKWFRSATFFYFFSGKKVAHVAMDRALRSFRPSATESPPPPELFRTTLRGGRKRGKFGKNGDRVRLQFSLPLFLHTLHGQKELIIITAKPHFFLRRRRRAFPEPPPPPPLESVGTPDMLPVP